MRPVRIERVAMIEKAAGRFRGGLPGRGPRGRLCARRGRWFVVADHAQCLVAGKNQLDCPHHDAAEWIAARYLKSTIACCLFCHVRQFVEVKIKTGHRADHVGIAATQDGMQRIRVLHMLLGEVVFILRRINVQPTIGYDSAFVERILVRVGQGRQIRNPARSQESRTPRPSGLWSARRRGHHLTSSTRSWRALLEGAL